MKNRAIKLQPLLTMLAVLIMVIAFPLSASAEAHGNFYIPEGAVPEGDEFTVTVEFTASDTIGTVQAAMSYNESYMQFVSGDSATGGGGIVNIKGFPDSTTDTMTISLTFLALREGSAQINLTNGSVMTLDGDTLSNAITAYATITIAPETDSNDGDSDSDSENDTSADSSSQDGSDDSYGDSDSDSEYENGSDSDTDSDTDSQEDSSSEYTHYDLPAQLKSLVVDSGELKPAFDPGIYSYTVTVPNEVDVLEIDAETANSYDSIWFEGARYLGVGKNTRTITVTSADGAHTNVYTVDVYREAEEVDSETDESYSDGETDSDGYSQTGTDSDTKENSTESNEKVKTSTKKNTVDSEDEKTGMEDLRDSLMPALYVAMAVIVLAMAILIVWIRYKTKRHKRKKRR